MVVAVATTVVVVVVVCLEKRWTAVEVRVMLDQVQRLVLAARPRPHTAIGDTHHTTADPAHDTDEHIFISVKLLKQHLSDLNIFAGNSFKHSGAKGVGLVSGHNYRAITRWQDGMALPHRCW